jgi:hypothetical protein
MLKTFSIAVVLTIAIAVPLGAQEAAGANQRGRAPRGDDPGGLNPADVINVLDGYAIVQAQEALQLSEAQYGPFVTRLKRLQETRRRNQQARHRMIQELRRVAGPQATATADEGSLRQQLKALRDHDDRSAEEIRKAYDGIDEVLDARQQARFRLFEERLELRKLDLLMRARQGAARRVK